MDRTSVSIGGSRNKSTKRPSKRKVHISKLFRPVPGVSSVGVQEVSPPHKHSMRRCSCGNHITIGNQSVLRPRLIRAGVWSRIEKYHSHLCAKCYTELLLTRDRSEGERIYIGNQMMSYHLEDANALLGSENSLFRDEDC